MQTQCDRLGKLLARKCGATAMEIILSIGTVCPHKRMDDLRKKGWSIAKKQVAGRTFNCYFGKSPKKSA